MVLATEIQKTGSNLNIPLLSLAALFGDDFSIDWIVALSGEKSSKVLTAMEEGIHRGILKQNRVGVYAFELPEKQTEYLSSYSEEEEAMLHRQVADLIQEEFPDNTDMLPILARHLINTASDVSGFQRLYDVGESLRKGYHQPEALKCYETVISALRLQKGNETDRLFVEAVIKYARICRTDGDAKWAIARIREALPRAEMADMQPFQALLKMHLARFQWQLGRQAAAIRQFEEGWSIAQESDNPDIKQYAVTFRMYFHFWQGRCRDLIGVYEDIEAPVARYPRSRFPIVATQFLASSIALCGKVTEGLGMLYGLQEHCREIGDFSNLRAVLMSISHVLLQIGRVDEMLRVLEVVESTLSENLDPIERITIQIYRAAALAFRGDQEEAETRLSNAAMPELSVFVARIIPVSAALLLPPLNMRAAALSIQNQSNRKEAPFIIADCSAFSEAIITSELFGHEKGAFTGALARKTGRFELAHGGTLFLDEIGNTPMEIQVRLLRVLQTKEFQRVGGIKTIYSDFRLIAATNRDLKQEVASGRFREDLYYRLNVFPITVPPLRERGDDIPLLALFFLKTYAAKVGKPVDNIPKAEMQKLLDYPWPGNVRELQSVIERGVILSGGSRFRVPELTAHSPGTDRVTLAENERRYILRVLEETGGKVRGGNGAAEYLGLHYSTLNSRMKKLGIESTRRYTN